MTLTDSSLSFSTPADSWRDEMVERYYEKLHCDTSRMLRRYPVLKRWEETDDVVQLSLMRLIKTLRSLPIESELHFCRLASLQVRRTLIDLARSYLGPYGLGANHETRHDIFEIVSESRNASTEINLKQWEEFHQLVDSLDCQHRDLFDLFFYAGSTTQEVARALKVSQRTAQRRWRAARLALCDAHRKQMEVMADQ